MKKLFFIVAILFSINCSAQDTTYVLKGNRMYEVVRTEVNLSDTNSRLKYEQIKLKKKRSFRRMNRIAFGVFILFTVLAWK